MMMMMMMMMMADTGSFETAVCRAQMVVDQVMSARRWDT